VKLLQAKINRKSLESSKRKNTTLHAREQGVTHFIVDFSLETMETRQHWNDIFKLLEERNISQPGILYYS
jgi:hypothetical protein